MLSYVLIALLVLVAIWGVLSVFDVIPRIRIVPDDTKFDFIRFRRISFPVSAILSILAITLIFMPSGLLGRPEVEKV